MKVTEVSSDGRIREMIFNESIVMAEATDSLFFTISKPGFFLGDWKFKFIFSKEGEPLKANADFNGREYNVTLSKWDAEPTVDASRFWEVYLDGKTIHLRWRVDNRVSPEARVFHLTIWHLL